MSSTRFSSGDVDGGQVLTDNDSLYPAQINELREVTTTGSGVYNVLDYGAIGDGVTSDSAAIQATIDAAALGNGSVYVPQGIYRLTTQITVKKGVYLQGCKSTACPRWNKADAEWVTTWYGSVFAVDWGAGGEAKANAAVLMAGFSGIDGINFYWPSQSGDTAAPVQYPPGIAFAEEESGEGEVNGNILQVIVRNIVMSNPWIGILFSQLHERLTIDNIHMTAWKIGIVVDGSTDVDKVSNIHMNPNVSYIGPWATNNPRGYHLLNNTCVGIWIGGADQIEISKAFVYGFYYAFRFEKYEIGDNKSVCLTQSAAEGCMIAVRSYGTRGLVMSDCIFGNHSVLGSAVIWIGNVNMNDESDAIQINNCKVWTSATQGLLCHYVNHIMVNNCEFQDLNSLNPGWTGACITLENCAGFKFTNNTVQQDGSNTSGYHMHLTNVDGFVIDNNIFRFQTRAGANILCDVCTKGRMPLNFQEEPGNGTGVTIAGTCTDVTSTEWLVYTRLH